jgi:hypothetical protein
MAPGGTDPNTAPFLPPVTLLSGKKKRGGEGDLKTCNLGIEYEMPCAMRWAGKTIRTYIFFRYLPFRAVLPMFFIVADTCLEKQNVCGDV